MSDKNRRVSLVWDSRVRITEDLEPLNMVH